MCIFKATIFTLGCMCIQQKCRLSVLGHAMQLPVCVCHLTTAEKTLLCPILSQCYAMPGHICQWRDLCRDVSPCVRPIWPEGPPLIWIMFLIVSCRWLPRRKQCRRKAMEMQIYACIQYRGCLAYSYTVRSVCSWFWELTYDYILGKCTHARDGKEKSNILHHPSV